ncbi:MAG: argininosuccinate lyase, partial [Lachnospiraceae bacterium]|nr:argininosuccinate lyase [Lachnospiraceae bacterium]
SAFALLELLSAAAAELRAGGELGAAAGTERAGPFRDAHGIIGRLVLTCIEKGKSIEEMSLEELKQISEVFDADIYEAVSLKTCVERRLTTGAPGIAVMKEVITEYRRYLEA